MNVTPDLVLRAEVIVMLAGFVLLGFIIGVAL